MRRAQDRARSAGSRKNGARSATIKSRALGALKLASEASCARWECAREAGRFFEINLVYVTCITFIKCHSYSNHCNSDVKFKFSCFGINQIVNTLYIILVLISKYYLMIILFINMNIILNNEINYQHYIKNLCTNMKV